MSTNLGRWKVENDLAEWRKPKLELKREISKRSKIFAHLAQKNLWIYGHQILRNSEDKGIKICMKNVQTSGFLSCQIPLLPCRRLEILYLEKWHLNSLKAEMLNILEGREETSYDKLKEDMKVCILKGTVSSPLLSCYVVSSQVHITIYSRI